MSAADRPTVLAVDGNSLAHRAWHALAGQRMGGAFVAHGVIRMLATAWSYAPQHGFDAVLVAFDSASSVRRDRHPDYKANRPDKAPGFHAQLAQLRQVVEDCGFGGTVTEGYEADDVLAATTEAARRAGARCTVLSSDRDLLALVAFDVTLLRPRASMNDLLVYDPAAVESEFGVPPDLYVELAALRGDPSDNLPGVRGIGQKTAAKLLRSFGGIDELYDGLRWLPHSTAKRLRAGRERVVRNLELMSPMGDHAVDVVAALQRGIDLGRLVPALHQHGLRAAATSLRFAIERGPEPPVPPPPAEEPAEHLARRASVAAAPRIAPAVEVEQVSLF